MTQYETILSYLGHRPCEESKIIADSKGSLFQEEGPLMEKRGFHAVNIDFTDMLHSYGYNPLGYIRWN